MQSLNLKRTLIMILLILSSIGAAFYGGLKQRRDVQISYISQAEILDLGKVNVLVDHFVNELHGVF